MNQKDKEQKELWAAFLTGEEKAFSALFFDYYSLLYNYGLKIVQEESLVKDVIQDFFLYLFENRKNLSSELQNLTSYLLASYRRRLLREVTQQRKKQNHQDNELWSTVYSFEIGMEEIMIRQESKIQNRQIIIRLLNELPPRQKEIIYLKYYVGLSLPKIAETLSISYQVVANHLYRAIKKLQDSEETKKLGAWRAM